MDRTAHLQPSEWLLGGGQLGELIRAKDWSDTVLGRRSEWPPALRTVVQLVVESQFPMALLWGPDLVMLYNDAFRIICAERHPGALGRTSREIWPEVWHINEPIFAAVMERGETIYLEDTCFQIDRHGRREDAYFTLCYSPVRGEAGAVTGTLVTVQETTTQVTQRRQLEQERERALDAFENGDACYVLDSQFRYVLVNRAQERSSGKSRAEILGRCIWEEWPEAADRKYKFWDVYHRVMDERTPEQFEEYFRPLDLWAEIHVFPTTEGGIAVFFRRINDRKKNEERLQESERELLQERQFLRAVIDSLSSMVMVRDTEGRCLLANEAAARFHGLTVGGLEGTNCHELAAVPRRVLDEDREVLRTGKEITDEIEVVGADGQHRSLMTTSTPLRNARGEYDRVLATSVDITWRKRAEQVVRESEDRLRLAMEATELGAFDFHPPSGHLIWSGHAKRHFGLPPDADVTYDTFLRGLHPDDRDRVDGVVQAVLRGETDGAYDVEYRTIGIEDGQERWLSARGRVLFDEDNQPRRFIGVTRDITHRKQMEEALREASERLTRIVDNLRASEEKFSKAFHGNAAAMTITRFADGEFIDLNDTYTRITGYTRDDLVGKSRPIWKRAEDRAAWVRALRETGSVAGIEARLVKKNGEEWAGLVSAQVVAISGEETVISSVVDITDRQRAEVELKEREADLREALGRLAEADRRKDEFIAILSHELRNPLAPIRYAIPVLEGAHLTGPATRAVEIIDRQLDHLTRLVDDLLDVSRITRGKIQLKREAVALRAIVDSAVEAASPAIGAARHTLDIAIDDQSIFLYVDAARVSQVITNLLNNSAKYTPRGGRITLEAGRDNTHAYIRVRDNGMGIAPDDLPTVFEMFRQVDRADKSQGGLGIGLALVKRLVEMHGGTIDARSGGAGQGSEFTVRLPVATDNGPVESSVATTARLAPPRRLTVLVVDDNPDLVEMLAMLVEARGHEVRKALDGRSAVSAALACRPDVVLLDLGLPVMNGLEVARELRRYPELRRTRLVALTGWGQAEDRRQTEDAGFDAHLTKPADPEQVERLLERCATDRQP